jgi:hypothetical protein
MNPELRTTWTEVHDDDALYRALEQARGSYQRTLLLGPDGRWRSFGMLAGRGWGKSAVNACWINEGVRDGTIHGLTFVGLVCSAARAEGGHMSRTTWTEVHDDDALYRALEQARGSYQRALLLGRESLSGSTLRGRASEYGARYASSRRALLDRMTAAGIPWTERIAEHGARVLVIGAADR